jgi:hypothetical protein
MWDITWLAIYENESDEHAKELFKKEYVTYIDTFRAKQVNLMLVERRKAAAGRNL